MASPSCHSEFGFLLKKLENPIFRMFPSIPGDSEGYLFLVLYEHRLLLYNNRVLTVSASNLNIR